MRLGLQLDERLADLDAVQPSANSDGCAYRKDLPAGAAHWFPDSDGKPAVLQFVCPCGCGAIGGVTVRKGGWNWNGSQEKPTLELSIQMLSHCRWHGYITDGVFHL